MTPRPPTRPHAGSPCETARSWPTSSWPGLGSEPGTRPHRVALNGLTARKTRTLMIMLGPIIGVAAMVCAIGLTESAKGQLQAQLAQLGTNLIIAQAGGTFGSQNPTFPDNAVARVEAVTSVTAAAGTSNLSNVVSVPFQGAKDYYEAFPVPVRAAGVGLPSVLQVPVTSGRWLDLAQLLLHTRGVV